VKFKLGKDSLKGGARRGAGGRARRLSLCKELHAQGATLSIADVDPLKAERAHREFGAEDRPARGHLALDCDVVSPCALGSAMNDQSIPRIKAKIVAGAAKPARRARHGTTCTRADPVRARLRDQRRRPRQRGAEVVGYDAEKSRAKTLKIYDTILDIAERSARLAAPTYKVADIMVEEKLALAPRV